MLSRGIAEIDDELVWIDSVETGTGEVTLAPFGRGWNGTTATTHAANARVTMNPAWPTTSIKQAISDTINSFFPKLFAVKSTTFTFSTAVTTYSLPADFETAISVTWDSIGPELEWYPVANYRPDKSAPTSEYATGKSISIYESILPGRSIKVTYRAIPSPLVNDSDGLVAVAGLPESCRDVIVLGAAQRLTSYVDAGRLNAHAVEVDEQDNPKPFGSGARASKDLFGFYGQRLRDEQMKLDSRFPIKVYRTGR